MSIIGINGRIGSGKDTIGSIIQYLTSECGDSNSPKHRTYVEFLQKGGGSNLRNFDQHYISDWEIKKFAGKLKQTASLLTGIPMDAFEDQEFKKTELGEDWNYYPIIGYGHRNIPVYGQDEQAMLVREFLQRLGTDAMRNNLHINIWVNALFADYTPTHYLIGALDTKLTDGDPVYPNWIITDMRFPNEMEAVKERKGITIRVNREIKHQIEALGGKTDVPKGYFPTNQHPSETALDDSEFDYEIINDETLEDLVEKVREILTKEKLI